MKTVIILITLLLFLACSSSKWRYQHTLPEGKARICFIGDTGLGGEVQSNVARALQEEGCHSVHHVGDIIYPDGFSSMDDPLLEERFMHYYRPVMKAAPQPVFYLTMGNHDYQGDVDLWTKISSDDPQIFFPNPYYLVEMQGLCLVHLDTNLLKYGRLFFQALKQLSWLSGLEKDLAKCNFRVALSHHPYKSRGHHGPASGTVKWFLSSRIIGKFDYYIAGHDHILSDEGREENTHLIISGAGGQVDKDENAGFVVLEAEVVNGQVANIGPHFIRTVPSSHQTSSP